MTFLLGTIESPSPGRFLFVDFIWFCLVEAAVPFDAELLFASYFGGGGSVTASSFKSESCAKVQEDPKRQRPFR